MNDNETLTKLVEQAIKGDKRALHRLFGNRDDLFINDWQAREVGSCHKDGAIVELVIRFRCPEFLKVCTSYFSISDLLFNHPFMQAACGDICALHKTSFVCVVERQQICRWGGHLDYKACPHYGAIGVMHNLVPLHTDPERLQYVRDNILEVK